MSDQHAQAAGQVSPDGQFVWSGDHWQPITRWGWLPTEWTRPMQLAAGGYFIISALYSVIVVFLLRDSIRQSVVKSIQTQSSTQSMTPDQVKQLVDISVNAGIAIAIVIGIIFLLLGLFTILRRWSWVFYVDLVLVGLSAIGIVTNLLALVNPNSATPAFQAILGILFSVVALAIFIWMLMARIQRGVWACRRAPLTD